MAGFLRVRCGAIGPDCLTREPTFARMPLDGTGEPGEDATVTSNDGNRATSAEERTWPTPVNRPEFWPLVASIAIGVLIGVVIGVLFL